MANFDASDIPFEEYKDKPIPFEADNDAEEQNKSGVSHAPLNLGGPDITQAPAPKPSAQATSPVLKTVTPTTATASSDRITGMKTFFTKLHAGAIDFLNQQVTDWLKNNPDIIVKRTNTVTGDVQGKKTEPNIIVTLWY